MRWHITKVSNLIPPKISWPILLSGHLILSISVEFKKFGCILINCLPTMSEIYKFLLHFCFSCVRKDLARNTTKNVFQKTGLDKWLSSASHHERATLNSWIFTTSTRSASETRAASNKFSESISHCSASRWLSSPMKTIGWSLLKSDTLPCLA